MTGLQRIPPKDSSSNAPTDACSNEVAPIGFNASTSLDNAVVLPANAASTLGNQQQQLQQQQPLQQQQQQQQLQRQWEQQQQLQRSLDALSNNPGTFGKQGQSFTNPGASLGHSTFFKTPRDEDAMFGASSHRENFGAQSGILPANESSRGPNSVAALSFGATSGGNHNNPATQWDRRTQHCSRRSAPAAFLDHEAWSKLWFATLEAKFVRAGICDEFVRFEHLMKYLSEDLITVEIENIISTAAQECLYGSVKDSLLKAFTKSSEQKVRRLISGLQYGNGPPSQLLAQIQRLASNLVSPAFLRQVWLDRLPMDIRVALAASEDQTDGKFVALADRIWGIQSTRQGQIFALSLAVPSDDTLDDLKKKLEELAACVRKLSQRQPRGRSRNRGPARRRRDKPNNDGPDSSPTGDLCWYHQEFAEKARHCMAPCSWEKKLSSLPEDATTSGNAVNALYRRLFMHNNKSNLPLLLDTGAKRFVVADVPYGILGFDFLRQHAISIDPSSSSLTHNVTGDRCETRTGAAPLFSIVLPNTVTRLLDSFPYITGKAPPQPSQGSTTYHHIITTGPPVAQPARRLAPDRLKEARRIFDELIAQGHPISRLEDYPANLHEKTIFSKIDLLKAFNQIPIAEEDVPKTAFITPFGLFEFTVMMFGFKNAAQTFQRKINNVLRGLNAFPYIDDILIASEHGLCVNLEKCVVAVEKVKFLGYEVSAQGSRPLPDKVQAVLEFALPTTLFSLRRFIGMVNAYRRCLKDAAVHLGPLHALLKGAKKKDMRPVQWDEASSAAFQACRSCLVNAAMLAHPRPYAQLRISTDASDTKMGAVLEQLDESWQPLGFFSKPLSATEQRYSAYDRELTTLFTAVKHFRGIVEGYPLTLRTDHKPLTHAFNQNTENAAP
ncbi:uncharacterized protein LOC106637000 [Copidosoma floridanum]|uniref:uncharacterized protein LOC106637000 n=1 Tax=Copidosoma floridanum TaxID=29053 RepID=UPI0006C97283|nr:uncharacterized protein LOC106637000 [Copidosoma floridanum]